MNILVDENLPPALAKALAAIHRGNHVVIHLRERFGPGVSDLTWINDLTRDGQWIVISGDRRITRNRAEYQAFRNSRLIGFFLSAGLQKSSAIKQLERILALWDVIETICLNVDGGAMFELPIKSTRVKQLKLS